MLENIGNFVKDHPIWSFILISFPFAWILIALFYDVDCDHLDEYYNVDKDF